MTMRKYALAIALFLYSSFSYAQLSEERMRDVANGNYYTPNADKFVVQYFVGVEYPWFHFLDPIQVSSSTSYITTPTT